MKEVRTNERILLLDGQRYAASSVTKKYEKLGLNTYHGNRTKASLFGKGLVHVRDIPTDNGRIKMLQLTEAGKQALKNLRENPARSHRKGGPEHEYWKKRLAAPS